MHARKWEVCEEAAAKKRFVGGVRVSVNPSAEITFDVGTYRAMGEPQAVVLMYEEKTETIGIAPEHADKPHALIVRTRHAKSNRIVRSTAFFKKYGITPATTLILPHAYLEGNVLILDMRTAVAWGAGWKRTERAEAKRLAAAEIRAERAKQREEARAEKERLKAERQQLSQDRARLRAEEQRMKREARERERVARKYEQALAVEAENLAKRERDHLSLGSG
jgi:flagellar biosynthesis GTPase FlhF